MINIVLAWGARNADPSSPCSIAYSPFIVYLIVLLAMVIGVLIAALIQTRQRHQEYLNLWRDESIVLVDVATIPLIKKQKESGHATESADLG